MSLQTRLALWSAFLLALTLLVIGLGTSLFLYERAVGDLDRQLARVADRVFHEMETESGDGDLPAGESAAFVEAVRSDGSVVLRSRNLKIAALPASAPGFSNVRTGNRGLRLGTFMRNGVTVRVAEDLDRIENLVRDLATAFLVALPFALGVVFFGGRWIARKALAPVEAITLSAEQLTARELGRRVPIPEADDPIRRLALVLNDTFERLEANFQQAMRFSADASHELKTPLTVLRSSIEALLRSDSLRTTDQQIVAGLLEQTQRISSITSGLLLLARADAGKLVIERRTVDLRAVIIACGDDARIVAEAGGISFTLTLPESAQVCGDETRLMQIVSNLLDNAVKYNHPRGEVRVVLERVDGTWSLKVLNTGPGIAPEHRPHLFERFFRAEHSANVSGQGLGLSLARELARAHGGDLTLTRADADWTELQLSLRALQGL
jgi:signal transduction histidine kinase